MGVDRVLRKSYKWYRKLAFCLITYVILNAHKVFQHHTGKKDKTFWQFMHDTTAALITSTPLINGDMHVDDTFPGLKKAAPAAMDKQTTKPCRVCTARGNKTLKGKRLKTVYIWKECPSEPGLHPGICFEAYHTMLDYSK